jgi:hypothetical protein
VKDQQTCQIEWRKGKKLEHENVSRDMQIICLFLLQVLFIYLLEILLDIPVYNIEMNIH